ncbi:MAG: magnesium transporter CorA family protein [Anaerolineaceae bacterium]|nr:magnesium transporter CorA family protein [Anaerolineaceae bacterium]
MIENMVWGPKQEVHLNVSTGDLKAALAAEDRFVWVNLHDEPVESSRAMLIDVFDFHPLAIEDALEETHVPRIDEWGGYLYLVLRIINPNQDFNKTFTTRELDVFISGNYIVTHQEQGNLGVEKIWQLVLRNPQHLGSTPIHLLYLILDNGADDFILSAEKIDLILNDLEDQVFIHPEPEMLELISKMKQGLMGLRQVVAPQREVLNKMARGDYLILEQGSRVYFRDIYDHFHRLYELIDNLRDLTSNALEIYLSVVNNKMSNVMKTLTIITTLFMPISFLTGFFGMNFFQPVMGPTTWTGFTVFHVILGIMILLPVGMLIFIFRRGWLK